MPIDPTGTKPGLSPAEEEPKKVHMRCRRNGCDSILAVEVTTPDNQNRLYRCAKCHHPAGVATGGSFNFG